MSIFKVAKEVIGEKSDVFSRAKKVIQKNNSLANLLATSQDPQSMAGRQFSESENRLARNLTTGSIPPLLQTVANYLDKPPAGVPLADYEAMRTAGIVRAPEIAQGMTGVAENINRSLAVPDPGFIDRLQQAIGSTLPLGLAAIPASRALGLAGGIGAGTIAETAMEGTEAKRRALEKGFDAIKAAEAEDIATSLNLPLLAVTNAMGPLGDVARLAAGKAVREGALKNIIKGAVMEGPLQEAPQAMIGNIATGDPLMQGVPESALIGSLIGGGMGGVTGATNIEETQKEIEQIKDALKNIPQTVGRGVEKVLESTKTPLPLMAGERSQRGSTGLPQDDVGPDRTVRDESGKPIVIGKTEEGPDREKALTNIRPDNPAFAIKDTAAKLGWKEVERESKDRISINGDRYYTLRTPYGVRLAFDLADIYTRPDRPNTVFVGEQRPNRERITLQAIVVDPEVRKKGMATEAIIELKNIADENGITIALEPTTMREYPGKLNTKQLIEFYKNMGFVQRVKDDNRILEYKPHTPKYKTADTFYSKVSKVIDEKMPNAATPEMVRGILSDKNAVKKEELEWMGLDDFLAGKEKVTKKELQDFIAQNQVQIKEKVLSNDKVNEELKQLKEAADFARLQRSDIEAAYGGVSLYVSGQPPKWGYKNDQGEFVPLPELTQVKLDEITDIIAKYEAKQKEIGDEYASPAPAKFASYQLPGGENYRELLLTLPTAKTKTADDFAKEMFGKPYNELGGGQRAEVLNARNSKWRAENFRSQHFDEPNILAHVRMNDRVDADGKKVLFVEEVQSDWHQEGRKKGYNAQDTDAQMKIVEKKMADLVQEYPYMFGGGRTPEIQNQINAYGDELNRLTDSKRGVPDAPFKKTWHELAMKRMLRYAAENGYDKLAWTTGEQQAERYDLSKQIDKLIWNKESKNLLAYKGGDRLINKNVPDNELPDMVGKEVAEKLLTGKPNQYGNIVLYDDSLKVGGEGMKGFYDQMLPSFMNKYTKKWGGRVGLIELVEPEGEIIAKTTIGKVYAVDITPSMKESVLSEGQPMFKKRPSWDDLKQKERQTQEERAKNHAEGLALVKELLPELADRVEIVDNIFMPNGKKAVGVYLRSKIGVTKSATPIDYIHEIGHGVLDLHVSPENHKLLFEEAIEKYGTEDTYVVEEHIMDGLEAEYEARKSRRGWSEKARSIFRKIIESIKAFLGIKKSRIQEFYDFVFTPKKEAGKYRNTAAEQRFKEEEYSESDWEKAESMPSEKIEQKTYTDKEIVKEMSDLVAMFDAAQVNKPRQVGPEFETSFSRSSWIPQFSKRGYTQKYLQNIYKKFDEGMRLTPKQAQDLVYTFNAFTDMLGIDRKIQEGNIKHLWNKETRGTFRMVKKILDKQMPVGGVKPTIEKAVGISKPKTPVEVTEESMLKRELQQEQKASKEGYKAGIKEIKQMFSEKNADLKIVRDYLVDYIKSNLPLAERGKLLTDLRDVTPKSIGDALLKVEKIRDELTQRAKEEEAKKRFTPEQRKQLFIEAMQKGLIIKEEGKIRNRLDTILRNYPVASFEEVREYIASIRKDEARPFFLKLSGDITKDANLMKLIDTFTNNWRDINKIEVNTLDMQRVIEKVTGLDSWDMDNILSQNVWDPISTAMMDKFNSYEEAKRELHRNIGGMRADTKASAEAMRKAENGERLTAEEKKAVDYIRGEYDKWLPIWNEARALIGKKPVKYRQNYLTHIREQNLLMKLFNGDRDKIDRLNNAELDALRKSNFSKPLSRTSQFEKPREGQETKYDLIGNYEKYLESIMDEIYIAKSIQHARKFISYALLKFPNAYKMISNTLDKLAGKPSMYDSWGIVGTIVNHPMVGKVRGLIAGNALIANLNFLLTNASNIGTSAGELGIYTVKGLEGFLTNKKMRQLAFENSRILQQRKRQFDVDVDAPLFLGSSEMSGMSPAEIAKAGVARARRAAEALTRYIEYVNVGSTWVGAYMRGTQVLKMTPSRALKYADTVSKRSQAGYSTLDLNLIMQSNVGKTALMFQTWTFNAMNHLLYDMKIANIANVGKNVFLGPENRLPTKVEYGKILRLLAVLMFTNMLYEYWKLNKPYSLTSGVPRIPGRLTDIPVIKFGRNVVVGSGLDALWGERHSKKERKESLIEAFAAVSPTGFGGMQAARLAKGEVLPGKEWKAKEEKQRAIDLYEKAMRSGDAKQKESLFRKADEYAIDKKILVNDAEKAAETRIRKEIIDLYEEAYRKNDDAKLIAEADEIGKKALFTDDELDKMYAAGVRRVTKEGEKEALIEEQTQSNPKKTMFDVANELLKK